MSTLTELIDKLITEKTFSLDGVKAIEQMRQKAEAQEARIAEQKTTVDDLRKENATLRSENGRLSATLDDARKNEAALASREAMVVRHETARAVAEASMAAYKDAMTIVFRPNTVRETAQRNYQSQYYTPGSQFPNTSTMSMPESSVREEG